MVNSTGCKVALTAVIVAIVMGGLGFTAGVVVDRVWLSDSQTMEAETIVIEVTAVPEPEDARPSPTEAVGGVEPAEAVEPTEGTAGEQPTEEPAQTAPIDVKESFSLFWEAWNIIEEDYYGELPSDEELTYGAIRGATNTLDDPYTAFSDPDAAEYRRQTSGASYEGIGAFVDMEDGRLIIVRPMKGQPAESAGLQADDIVLQVDDTPIQNMSLYEAIGLILGPAGTEVRLTILRMGEEPFEVTITRAKIDMPTIEVEMRDDGIAYLALLNFNFGASQKLAGAIQELLVDQPEGLVLDLRGNPGGFLSEAVLVPGLFLPQDEVVVIERTKDDEDYLRPEDYGSEGPVAPEIPMVVLVDGASASASEIVAGALQDHGRAVLVGETTFGKGSVQGLHELSNGAELRVTIARWFTPDDRAIHGEGLEPDYEVELSQEDLDADRDPQLDRAVEYLLTGQ